MHRQECSMPLVVALAASMCVGAFVVTAVVIEAAYRHWTPDRRHR